MTIIGWTSERLAAALCDDCASARWSPSELARGHENAAPAASVLPIFRTDEPPECGWTCDDCLTLFD